VGTKLWGSVLEASATRLVVALPSGLRGTVRASEVRPMRRLLSPSRLVLTLSSHPQASDAHAEHVRNAARAAAASGSDEDEDEAAAAAASEAADDPSAPPPLHAQFAVGQLLRVVVVALGAGAGDSGAAKRVELSARLSRVVGALPLAQLRPGRALPATVRSVEDHGYVLCLGPSKASGFLPRALAPKTKQPLRPGAHLEAVVTAVDATRRVVAVTAAPAAVASALLADADDVALAALLPGALVSARVRAVLPDGLQLTFLTYFTGTVDWFHLDTPFPTPGALGAAYAEGAKLKARILFVDAATKRVGLTLRRRLLDLAPPSPLPAIGTRLPGCVVRRVDPDVGLLCALPAADDAAPQAGYVHISAVADSRVEKLEKKFKRGQEVEARVVGSRPLEDCAVLSLKPSVLRAAFFGYADVAPGSLVDCVVEAVDAAGAALSLGAGLRARAATQHLSDTGAARAGAKLKPGAAVRGRVLAVDAAARRVTVTLKPSLVNSKLPALATPTDAPAGTAAHGFVTGVQPYGVFVAFYGQLRGLAHVSHLGLEGGQAPADAFAPGQVVKATVLGATTHAQRGVVLDLALGAASKKALSNAAAEADDAAATVSYEPLQEVPSATVLRVVASGRRGVEVALTGGGSAFLEEAQLADSAAAAAALLDALALLPPGTELGPLLVLARAPGGRLALSRKPALRSAASSGALPHTFADCQPGQLLTGFVAGITAAGVFVRFAERLTGLAPPSQLADAFVASPASAFSLGQTVAAKVYTVDAAAGRLALSLKPSACRGEGASALRSALAAGAELDALHAAASAESAAWAEAYPPGRVLDATVAEVKPYGTVLDIAGDEAAVGFVLPAQASGASGGAPAAGAPVRGVVLDVNRREGVVDVGLRAELLPAKGSKAKAPKPGASVTAVVELVKPDYLVCSLPKHGAAVAYLQLGSFNARPDAAADAAYSVGQSLSAVVAEAPSDATGGRMLLLAAPAADEAADGEAPARDRAQQATVVAVRPTEAHLRLDNGRYGRLHATSMPPPPTPAAAPRGKRGTAAAAAAAASPLAALAPGAALRVFVTGHARGDPAPDGKSFLELALPGADGAAPRDEDAPYRVEALSPGDSVTGVVDSVAPDGAWIALTPQLRGRLACLDGSADADEAKSFCARLQPGQSLRCAVLQVDAPRRHLDLTTRLADAAAKPDAPPRVGDVLPGRVTRAVPGVGLYVQLPAHKAGRVALTGACCSLSAFCLALAPARSVRSGVRSRCDETRSNRCPIILEDEKSTL
jgi:rRNA biogenesis protein RRP5